LSNEAHEALEHKHIEVSLDVIAALASFRPALPHVHVPEVLLFVSEADVESEPHSPDEAHAEYNPSADRDDYVIHILVDNHGSHGGQAHQSPHSVNVTVILLHLAEDIQQSVGDEQDGHG